MVCSFIANNAVMANGKKTLKNSTVDLGKEKKLEVYVQSDAQA